MAFQLPQMPNFNVQQPPPFDPLAQQTKTAQLKNMLSETALRQQLAPLQVQEQQQRNQQQQTANAMAALQLFALRRLRVPPVDAGLVSR